MMKNKFKSLLLPFYHLRATIAYRRAVRMADKNLRETRQRTYVIKASGLRLMLVDRNNFRMLKRKSVIRSTATIMDLQQHCLYCTPYADGKEPMPQEVIAIKKAQCIKWLVNGYNRR